VKPVDPILTCLVIEIVINEELSFSSSKYDDSSLFSHEKRLEMRKNKFGTQMYLLKIKGIDHFIAKKNKWTKMYFINKFKNATYVTHVFHFNPLSFNSIVPTKKRSNWVLILAQKSSIMQKKKFQRSN
jgi:hypothetical protein